LEWAETRVEVRRLQRRSFDCLSWKVGKLNRTWSRLCKSNLTIFVYSSEPSPFVNTGIWRCSTERLKDASDELTIELTCLGCSRFAFIWLAVQVICDF
jgi:hypothetical protein